jgi:hypothetical protein
MRVELGTRVRESRRISWKQPKGINFSALPPTKGRQCGRWKDAAAKAGLSIQIRANRPRAVRQRLGELMLQPFLRRLIRDRAGNYRQTILHQLLKQISPLTGLRPASSERSESVARDFALSLRTEPSTGERAQPTANRDGEPRTANGQPLCATNKIMSREEFSYIIFLH